ncbi:MAG: penicillin-binding transpeptidase domain-containing protein [Phycisphaerales bacterium]
MPAARDPMSMFHRRLLLVGAGMVGGFLVLGGQVWRLAAVQGEEHRHAAESKLVDLSWERAARGRILDRKDRVIAQDRPSFSVCVEYRVLSGQWALRQAAEAARQVDRAAWRAMSAEQRQQRIDVLAPAFQEHVERMWERLASETGTPPDVLARSRDKIVGRVSTLAASIFDRRVSRDLDGRLSAGLEITEEAEARIVGANSGDVAEQRSPHVVLEAIPDAAGFELKRLARAGVEIRVPGIDRPVTVPMMPGLTVVDAGSREYPFERVTVEVDASSLPGPLKAERKVPVTVEGVAYHVIGRTSAGANADTEVMVDGKAGRTLGHRARRARRVDAESPAYEAAFADRALTPEGWGGLPTRVDRGRYEDTDAAGIGGVEESQEERLRGLRGVEVERLETGERVTLEPMSGQDVHLTLDVMLQARIQAIMSPDLGLAVAQRWQRPEQVSENPSVPDGSPLNGAAVVIEIDTGDILAMVSSPSMPRRLLRESPSAVFGDPMNAMVAVPWLDRTVGRPYPPGSIVKAILLNAAVKLGESNLDAPIDCTGHLYPNKPDQFRCWIFKDERFQTTHTARLGHALSAREALMVSCNIYFFTIGQRLGPTGIVQAYSMFGVGQPWNLGVGTEVVGILGPRGNPAGIGIGDATQMGIGQGPVAWTPLHAADAYATLGRGGVRIAPRVIAGASPEPVNLELDPRAVRAALDGLDAAVNEESGTGHHVDVAGERLVHFAGMPGLKVWGKTGTAQAPRILVKRDDPMGKPLFDQAIADPGLPESTRVLREGDHSWFVVLVGEAADGRPRYAISVMMEYAGSGGRVSGPIVAQIIRALKVEGYL